MEADDDLGILAIDLSDSDDAQNDGSKPGGISAAQQKEDARAARIGQTEEQFLAVKKQWRPRVDNGEIWKSIELPLPPGAGHMENKALVHAVEELYFLRRYEEGAVFADKVLQISGDGGPDEDARKLLLVYRERCLAKLESKRAA